MKDNLKNCATLHDLEVKSGGQQMRAGSV